MTNRLNPTDDLPPQLVLPRPLVIAFFVLTAGGLAVLPAIVAPGRSDTFRLIKELALRAEGVLALVLLAAAVAWGGSARLKQMLREDRAAVILLMAAIAWTAITTLLSTNRLLSVISLVDVGAAAAVFVMVWYGARWLPSWTVVILVVTAVLNATLVTLQELSIWQPFDLEIASQAPHLANSALLGNPNDVGSYLALVAVVLFAVAGAHRGRLMILYGSGALIAMAGVVVSQTRTAALAVVAGLLVVAIRRSRKVALATTVLLVFAIGTAVVMQVKVVVRIIDAVEMAAAGRFNEATSNRFTPMAAAFEMFREKPATGFGPQTFRYHHMRYAVRVQSDSAIRTRGSGTNFADVHNDHLQLLAETGLPGYLIFLGSLFFLSRTPGTERSGDTRARMAAATGLPFAVTLAVLCLAQFPLHLAVTRGLIVTIAALVVGWRRL